MTPWNPPEKWDFGVYVELWTRFNVSIYFANSFYYASTSVVLCVSVSAMAAYGLTRLKWRLKGAVLGLILLGLMVPIHSELVPLYIIVNKLGFRNPKINLVGIFMAFSIPVTVFILSGYIRSIPKEIEEAAVYGANDTASDFNLEVEYGYTAFDGCRFTVSTDVFAHAVHFGIEEEYRLSDSFFDLLPGESREVRVLGKAGPVQGVAVHAGRDDGRSRDVSAATPETLKPRSVTTR